MIYSGDLNNEHLNKGNICITMFYLATIQMPGNSWLFKTSPEQRTKNLQFKPTVMQPISQTTYNLNNKLIVHYSSHGQNTNLLVCYSNHDLNNEPFDEQTILNNLKTKLVHYSDPDGTLKMVNVKTRWKVRMHIYQLGAGKLIVSFRYPSQLNSPE